LKSEDHPVNGFNIISRTKLTPQYEPADPEHKDRRC